ncbi:hypothetical protein DXG01_002114 [Tephrocybe rancida]|nr:hypothetical protein DXG01_002114 [Tephrocybe rancida]
MDMNHRRSKPTFAELVAGPRLARQTQYFLAKKTRDSSIAQDQNCSRPSPDDATFDSYIALYLRRGNRKPAFYRGDHVLTADRKFRLGRDYIAESPEDLILYFASDSISALREAYDLTSTRHTIFFLFGSASPELRALASPGEYTQKEFNLLSTDTRIRATRGMIVDFALLSGISDVCKMAAAGLEWNAVFGEVDSTGAIDKAQNRWVEIDRSERFCCASMVSNETRVPPTAPTSGRMSGAPPPLAYGQSVSMSTHTAIAITEPGKVDVIQVPTGTPGDGQVLIKVEYASLIVLDTYMSDVGYFVQSYPVILGFNASGTVAQLGNGVTDLAVGDRVVAVCFADFNNKGTQEYTTQPRIMVSKVPDSLSLESAVTIPENLITAFYTLFNQLELPVPPSFPVKETPPLASTPILIYGAGSTSGQYMVQLLRAAGYTNVLATASAKHHAYLKSIGATGTFDYNNSSLAEDVAKYVGGDGKVPLVVDCIAAVPSMAALAKIVSPTGTVALLMPFKKTNTITVKHASDMTNEFPQDNEPFSREVKLLAVRANLAFQDPYLRDNLATKIIPSLLEKGIIEPNRVRLMDQGSFKDRVEQGLDLLRNDKISGEKVVVKVDA